MRPRKAAFIYTSFSFDLVFISPFVAQFLNDSHRLLIRTELGLFYNPFPERPRFDRTRICFVVSLFRVLVTPQIQATSGLHLYLPD